MSAWWWAAEALAEAGYVVMYYANVGNAFESAVDAIDFFVATPDNPSPQGEFNPWHARVDPSRLAILGHSGGAIVALHVGQADPRVDAIVSWDPMDPLDAPLTETLRTPTMIHVSEYWDIFNGPTPRQQMPPTDMPKYTFFDAISAAGVDTMQVAVRASTHVDWQHFPSDLGLQHGIFGETVALYYSLAWLDRYLAPARGTLSSEDVASDALRRLTASGEDPFDASADEYSIGAGLFDADEAQISGDDEAGNVPIKICGVTVRSLLSFQYDSRYFLDGGALQCNDMRAGCP